MNNSSLSAGVSRRRFVALAGMAALAPMILTRSYGQDGKPRPSASKRITVGVVGWGMQGPGNTGALLGLPDCQVVAACDLDTDHLKSAVDTINGHYKNTDCKAYHDYHELMANKDIDAVMLPSRLRRTRRTSMVKSRLLAPLLNNRLLFTRSKRTRSSGRPVPGSARFLTSIKHAKSFATV